MKAFIFTKVKIISYYYDLLDNLSKDVQQKTPLIKPTIYSGEII